MTKTEDEKERERDLRQGTKHSPGEKDDPLGNKESQREGAKRERGKDNAQIPVLLNQRQGNATEVNTAVRAAAQRTEDHGGGYGGANTKGEAPANTPSMHGIEGQLKVSLGSGGNDEVISVELASVTEGVRGGEGNTRDGRVKGDNKTVN